MNAYTKANETKIPSILYRIRRIGKEKKELKGGVYFYVSIPLSITLDHNTLVLKFVFDTQGEFQDEELEYFFSEIDIEQNDLYFEDTLVTEAHHRGVFFMYKFLEGLPESQKSRDFKILNNLEASSDIYVEETVLVLQQLVNSQIKKDFGLKVDKYKYLSNPSKALYQDIADECSKDTNEHELVIAA